MSDRLHDAFVELEAAVREKLAASAKQGAAEPERLLSIDAAAKACGIGRTALYAEIGAGRVRSLKVGRRRLVPQSAIADLAAER